MMELIMSISYDCCILPGLMKLLLRRRETEINGNRRYIVHLGVDPGVLIRRHVRELCPLC